MKTGRIVVAAVALAVLARPTSAQARPLPDQATATRSPANPQDGSPAKISIRVAPSTDAATNAQTFAAFDQYFEPTTKTLDVALSASDLSRRVCGRQDVQWLTSFMQKNAIASNSSRIPAGTKVLLPPCPFWRLGGSAVVSDGESVSSIVLREVGQSGPLMLAKVAKLNGKDVEELNSVSAGDTIKLPFKTARVAHTVRFAYGGNVDGVISAVSPPKRGPATKARSEVALTLIGEDDAACDVTTAGSDPFDAARVAEVLERNATIRPPRKAIVAVIDTGIDIGEKRLFLATDPDGNVGLNVDLRHPGFPTTSLEYPVRGHGTHVAGLVLGGLASDRLTAAVKGRIELQIINIVSTDVIPDTAGVPREHFSIPLTNLQEAIGAARRDPPAPILNVSVETSVLLTGMRDALTSGDYLVVAAAGNDFDDIDLNPVYPAAFKRQLPFRFLTVAANDADGEWVDYSNQGPLLVDLTAPGCNVQSILPGGNTGTMTGTSQAAPQVTFVAALLYSEGLTPQQIRNRIRATIRLNPNLRPRVATGGQLDVEQAVSVNDDIVRIAGQQEPLKGRIVEPDCIPVAGTCRPLEQVARLVADYDPQQNPPAMAWVVAKDGEVVQRPTSMPVGVLKFRREGSAASEDIDWRRVTDVITRFPRK